MPSRDLEASDAAVAKATGRSWEEWKSTLDEWGGPGLSHRELVTLVRERGEIDSGWWQQTVVVGYEKLTGRRITGQTADGRFQIGVQRTIDGNLDTVWGWLTSRKGLEAWLGISHELTLEKGERYRSRDEVEGEIRVIHPGNRLRITRKPKAWERPSTIQIRVGAKGDDRTVVGFHEENLPGPEIREERRRYFRAVLEQLESDLA